MKFVELSGRTLSTILSDDELSADDLVSAKVNDDTICRINQQGDIEVRRHNGWDVIGGLLGDFGERLKHETGLDWA
jgi:hypothetical protein